MKRKILFIIASLLIGVAAGITGYAIGMKQGADKNISSYDECVAAGYPVMESSPEQCKISDGKNFSNTVNTEQSVSLEGHIICLPHKDTDRPHTLECAVGLQISDGKNYALKASNELADAAGSDKQVRISGTLKTEPSNQYQTEGTIEVTDFAFIQ